MFQESGVGINDSKVYIDLSDIGMPSNVQADNCNPSWKCYWEGIAAATKAINSLTDLEKMYYDGETEFPYAVNAKKAVITVLSTSEDDLGNKADKVDFNISVDVFPPEIVMFCPVMERV